jgi:N-acetylneuraminic acid mutarotase
MLHLRDRVRNVLLLSAISVSLVSMLLAFSSPRGVLAQPVASGVRAAAWTPVQPLPAPRQRTAVAVGHDGAIYVFGGDAGDSVSQNTTFIYHPALNMWGQGAPMPTARMDARAATLPDGRILVMGGDVNCTATWACTALNAVEIYSPRTNTWSTAAPLHTARYVFGAALGRDGRVYAMGGLSGNQVLSSVEVYDAKRNAWGPAPSLPRATMATAATTDRRGDIVVVGGEDYGPHGTNELDTTQIYNGKTWVIGAPMPTARHDLGATTGADGQIYVLGGWSGPVSLATVEVYNPLANAWLTGVPLPQATCCMGAASLRATGVYAIGGAGTPGGFTNQVFLLPVTPLSGTVVQDTRGARTAGMLKQ